MLFGYDQGVVSGVLGMESFAAKFPRIYMDTFFKGWFTSTLLLAAWLGSLLNGPIADRIGRKGSILLAVCIFLLGSALQAGAKSVPMLFTGRHITTRSRSGILVADHNAIRSCYRRPPSWYADHDRTNVHV